MAGAAIWCADKIVGVVSNHQHTDGRNRVAAADVTSWYAGLATDRLAELTEMLELPGSLDEVEPMHSARAGTLTTAEYCRAFPRRRHRILDVEREHAIADSFVRPPGWDDASRVLDESQILLLRAEPGSGGRTAAIHLLRDFGRPSEPIHELAPQRDLGPELLDPREIVADERLLLDLSAVGSEQVRAIMAELPLLDEGALHPDAVLVVVLPTGDEHLLEPELRPWTASVGRPDGRAVFRAQLAAQGVSGDYPSSPPQQLDAVLAHGTMAEIAGLARTVRAAQDRAEALSLADLIGEALAARAERNDEVAALVAQHADGGFRSLLLASAMLEGRTAEDVLEAQRSLLRMLDVATDTDHEFERAGLAIRFHEVEAEIDSESVVRFPKLKCAEAIRRHLWTNYPAVRDGLRQWVVECGARMAWPSAAGDEFARRLVDACLSAQKPSDVLIAVSSWAFGGTTQVALAASALAYGLEDPRTGWWFRRHCYQWASTRTLQPQIAELVIPACVEIIAPNHPGHAVVLLHHFSRNRDSRVAGAARSALASLTDDRRVVRRLLARLTTSPHGRLDSVDRVLFLAAARPTTLTSGGDDAETLMADPDVRRELRIGWGAILSYCREAEYEKYVHRWLDAHVVDQTYGFLDVLVAACGDGFLPAATVRTIARHWYDGTPGSDDREDRWRTVQELDDRLYTFRRQR